MPGCRAAGGLAKRVSPPSHRDHRPGPAIAQLRAAQRRHLQAVAARDAVLALNKAVTAARRDSRWQALSFFNLTGRQVGFGF